MNYILGVLLSLYSLYFTDARSVPECVTPNNKLGRCISLFECSDFPPPRPGKHPNAKARDFFHRSICGRSNNRPMVCCSSSVAFSTTTAKNELPFSGSCGLKNPQPKIRHGTNASLGEYPWMASLGFKTRSDTRPKWLCGGSLISNRYVLTAAHCVASKDEKFLIVRLGDLDLDDEVADGASPVDYSVQSTVVHENYIEWKFENDIALVKLRSLVQFTHFIKPICLPVANELSTTNLDKQTVYVAGWGSTPNEIPNTPSSNITHLQHVEISILDLNMCKEAYSRFGRSYVDNRNICAGNLKEGKDSCKGDSGGPLMWKNPTDSKYYVIGTVSFGYNCGDPHYPGVYAKVSEYVDWIQKNMNK